MTITVYGTPTCSQCKMFKKSLEEKNIDFEYSDDLETTLKIAEISGICSAPIVKIDDKYYCLMEAAKELF